MGFEPWSWDLSLEAGICALRLDCEPQTEILTGLLTKICASILGFEPGGWGFERGG